MLAEDGVSTLRCNTWVGARDGGEDSQAFVNASVQVSEVLRADDVDLVLGLECCSDLIGELLKGGRRLAKMIQLAGQGGSCRLGASNHKNTAVSIQFLFA